MQTINFEKYEVNKEQRTIVFSCASNAPYQRYDEVKKTYYKQVLVIRDDTVDMSRLNGGAAVVLFNHDTDKLLGIVESAWIVEDKIYVKVRFSANDTLADRVFKDILDGVIKNVSIGYEIRHYTEQKKDGEIYRFIDDFMIFETSIVSIPADQTVGIRAKNNKGKNTMKKRNKKAETEVEISNAETAEETTAEVEQTETAEQPEAAEQSNAEAADIENTEAPAEDEIKRLQAENAALKLRIEELEKDETEADISNTETAEQSNENANNEDAEEIEKIGKDFDIDKDEIKAAIKNNMTVREFKNNIRNSNFTITSKEKHTMKNEFREFLQARDYDKPFMLRDFTGFGGKNAENGAPLIGTETMPLVAALEKRMGVKGFRVLSGLTSNVSIPVQTGRQTISQKSDIRDAASNSNPVFSAKTLTPVKFAGVTRVGKELLVQANDDVIAFVIDSLTKEIGYTLQSYMLGKVESAASNAITYTDSNSFDWADALAFEGYVGGYSLETSFVMSAGARAMLKGIEKAANTAQFICDADNKINGYDVNVSGCVGNDKIYFGDWSHLICGTFGEGLEIVVNPYTYATYGDVEIVASLCADAVVDAPAAFVVASKN